VQSDERTKPAPTGEARFGGHGMWAPMIPISRHPDEWVCWVGDPDEGLEPVVVRSVD
jgi:hypothetical protein